MLLVYSIMAFHGKLMGCAKRMLGYSDCVSTYEYHKLKNVDNGENEATDKTSLLNDVDVCKV